jgi:hypothetical protein
MNANVSFPSELPLANTYRLIPTGQNARQEGTFLTLNATIFVDMITWKPRQLPPEDDASDEVDIFDGWEVLGPTQLEEE